MNQNCSYKDSCLLLNNLNGIKKHVEDISVDAALGCKFCSVVVIYNANYNNNNSNYSKLPLSPLSHPRYQLGSSSNTVLHMSTCQLCHTVTWQTNKNEVVTQII